MSSGIRCDGCKDMIDQEGYDDYLELDLQRKQPTSSDTRPYHRAVATKHFHGRAYLYIWVHNVGQWDGEFSDLDLGLTEKATAADRTSREQ